MHTLSWLSSTGTYSPSNNFRARCSPSSTGVQLQVLNTLRPETGLLVHLPFHDVPVHVLQDGHADGGLGHGQGVPAMAAGPVRLDLAVGEQHWHHGRPELGPVQHRQVARQVLVLRPRGEESQQGRRGRTSVHGVPVAVGQDLTISGSAVGGSPATMNCAVDPWYGCGAGGGAAQGEGEDGAHSGQQGGPVQQQVHEGTHDGQKAEGHTGTSAPI